MRKKGQLFLMGALGPALLCFLVMFVYPLIRTVMMSFHCLPSISSRSADWEFVGLKNYTSLFTSSVFHSAMGNILKIWLIGGVATIVLALLFAVILTSGVKWKRFWRSAIYLPNTVSAVALSTMWLQYVFHNKFGLLKQLSSAVGLEGLAKINWTSPQYLFWGMLISYVYGCVGYFMLIFLSGIERIPRDLYESAILDGAGSFKQFWHITFPLIRGVFRTCVTLWTISSVNFFTWAKMFSPNINVKTVTPVYLLYNKVFGEANTGTVLDAGSGAALGVLVALLVLAAHLIMNRILKEEELEY